MSDDPADRASPTVRAPALGDRDVARLRDSVKDSWPGGDAFGGRFELVAEAGSGGMGIVYEAIDRDTGKRVAIKVITGLPSANDRARFAAEAEALERLDHPAIVDYVCHGVTTRDEPYLAMEWLVGESLAARLARAPLAVADVVVLGERIADALDHAHRVGVVHRDLKPSNIFLVDGAIDQAHVIDFGVAKLADRELTHTGQMIGTPGYMAPEQVRGDKRVNQTADLFALGCVLYKAVTGRDAFAGTEVMEVLARLLLEHPTPAEDLVAGVPPRLAHLISALLAKDAGERLGEAGLARDELRAIREALATNDREALALRPARVPSPSIALDRTVLDRPRRRASWPVAAAGGLAIAGVAAIVLVRGASGPTCSDDVRTGCAELCAGDDGRACYLLARTLHKNDVGIPIDHEAARAADRRACTLGEDAGCVGAARSLLDSARTFPAGDARRTTREAEAAGLLQGACDRGGFEACRRLGFELSRGFGQLAPDPVRAFALVERACTGGDPPACLALADMIADPANGASDAMRAHARTVRSDACQRHGGCTP